MAATPKLQLAFGLWPAEDQGRWQATFKAGDRFDDAGAGSHLAETTRDAQRESYARFLGFLSQVRPNLLDLPPETRIDRTIVADYVAWRRGFRKNLRISIDLRLLRGALRLIRPDVDWSWLLTIIKRIAVAERRSRPKYHLVTSEQLYALGRDLMDRAIADASAAGQACKVHAFQYRDGLIIAFLALIPVRSRSLAAIRVGKHLVKAGNVWTLDIPAEDTKTHRALDYPIANELSARIDEYLERFRSLIPGTKKHTGLWASNLGMPMGGDGIYVAVRKRTRKAFGFGVNLHRFRHAAASFWSIHDPANVRGAKDLLGQATFGPAESHYIMAQSRLAGRVLREAVNRVCGRSSGS
jgi:integrase/recombinase XerD